MQLICQRAPSEVEKNVCQVLSCHLTKVKGIRPVPSFLPRGDGPLTPKSSIFQVSQHEECVSKGFAAKRESFHSLRVDIVRIQDNFEKNGWNSSGGEKAFRFHETMSFHILDPFKAFERTQTVNRQPLAASTAPAHARAFRSMQIKGELCTLSPKKASMLLSGLCQIIFVTIILPVHVSSLLLTSLRAVV